MNTDAIEPMVPDVLSRMNSLQGRCASSSSCGRRANLQRKGHDYPLANKHPEWVKPPPQNAGRLYAGKRAEQ